MSTYKYVMGTINEKHDLEYWGETACNACILGSVRILSLAQISIQTPSGAQYFSYVSGPDNANGCHTEL